MQPLSYTPTHLVPSATQAAWLGLWLWLGLGLWLWLGLRSAVAREERERALRHARVVRGDARGELRRDEQRGARVEVLRRELE